MCVCVRTYILGIFFSVCVCVLYVSGEFVCYVRDAYVCACVLCVSI